MTPGAHHAARLLRWYPKDWRARYGEEFTELLLADVAERPRSWRRDADVAWSGLVARLGSTGLTTGRLGPAERAHRCLAALGCAAAVFLTFGVAVWSQVTIGWQWSAPDTAATSAGMVLMSAAIAVCGVLAVAAAVPVVAAVAARAVRRDGVGLRRPALLVLLGAAVLVAGARHFENGWPGTGGHPWPYQGIVPGGAAAFGWASTLSVSAYWAHPGALRAFPAGELAWMAVSPAAIACLVTGVVQAVRRVPLSPRALRFERRLGAAAVLSMSLFLAGALAWVSYGGPGPRGLFHAGVIDVAALAVMTVALGVACQAVRQASPTR